MDQEQNSRLKFNAEEVGPEGTLSRLKFTFALLTQELRFDKDQVLVVGSGELRLSGLDHII